MKKQVFIFLTLVSSVSFARDYSLDWGNSLATKKANFICTDKVKDICFVNSERGAFHLYKMQAGQANRIKSVNMYYTDTVANNLSKLFRSFEAKNCSYFYGLPNKNMKTKILQLGESVIEDNNKITCHVLNKQKRCKIIKLRNTTYGIVTHSGVKTLAHHDYLGYKAYDSARDIVQVMMRNGICPDGYSYSARD